MKPNKPNKLGYVAKKRFGQNFLHDQNVIQNIIEAINPSKNDFLVEIGPGLGALTEPVSEYVDKLTVIELDRDLAKKLRHHPFLKNKLEIIEQDALTVDFFELAKESNKKIRIFGNLPYNISTPLMFHLFQYADIIQDMFFMLQKEVVNRLVVDPNNKAYGRLTIMTQYFCEIIPVLEVPATAFTPQPKVESGVVCLIPRTNIQNVAKDLKLLYKVTTTAFNQRRKTLANSLANLFTKEELSNLNVDINARAENLSIDDYVNLANYLFNKNQN